MLVIVEDFAGPSDFYWLVSREDFQSTILNKKYKRGTSCGSYNFHSVISSQILNIKVGSSD